MGSQGVVILEGVALLEGVFLFSNPSEREISAENYWICLTIVKIQRDLFNRILEKTHKA
jgi:hypothetical protein